MDPVLKRSVFDGAFKIFLLCQNEEEKKSGLACDCPLNSLKGNCVCYHWSVALLETLSEERLWDRLDRPLGYFYQHTRTGRLFFLCIVCACLTTNVLHITYCHAYIWIIFFFFLFHLLFFKSSSRNIANSRHLQTSPRAAWCTAAANDLSHQSQIYYSLSARHRNWLICADGMIPEVSVSGILSWQCPTAVQTPPVNVSTRTSYF